MDLRTRVFLAFMTVFVVCCTQSLKAPGEDDLKVLATHFNGSEFLGSKSCRHCHADIYDEHLETAHYNTSAPAEEENLLGSFATGSNSISLHDATIEMVEEDGTYHQVTKQHNQRPVAKSRIDLVIGSGVKGQSHLNWNGDRLFQLQASYYPPADCWINSPGYPNKLLNRPIRDGCLKCHVTFATNKDFSGQGNQYDKTKTVYGVDCERCHRPAADHVRYHLENPDVDSPHLIMKLDTLSRQQRLDICAQCHSGPRAGILQGNSFSFLAGEKLDEYTRNFHSGISNAQLDVHGNQYGLLTSSACFQKSDMICGTCHDPHKNQRNQAAEFVAKCQQCHDTGLACGASDSMQQDKNGNCISCHMPNFASQAMTVSLESNPHTPVQIRTHHIAIYPMEEWDH